MTQHQGFDFAFLIVFILLVVELVVVVSPFLPTILWAIILAQLTHPIYLKVRDRSDEGRNSYCEVRIKHGRPNHERKDCQSVME